MNNEIIQLFIKYLNNQCAEDELKEVFKLIEEGNFKNEWEFVLTEDAAALVNSSLRSEMSDQEVEELHGRILKTLADEDLQPVIIPIKKRYWQRIAAAAVVLITLSIGALYYYGQHDSSTDLVSDIAPGGNKAILTLADGQKIVLTDAKNGELAAQAGVVVTKLADGQIVYTVQPGKVGVTRMNSIETPKGGQYQIVLPDGTKVLLNAASVLTYPASFVNAKSRRVQLKGEAYFEVAKVMLKKRGGMSKEQGLRSKEQGVRMPFIVVTDKQKIEVLGTHFNVNSYADEPFSKTTLVEGSVLVNASGGSELLTPGNQAIVGNGKLTVAEANVEEVLAWKNGYFMFDSEDIGSVMRKISRWYNVDVVFEGDVSKDRFGGTVSRFSNVSKVLRKLELTNKVHFRMEERRIIVTK